MIIKIDVQNKIPKLLDDCVIICGNSNYEISFSFDNEWDKYTTRTARFSFFQNNAKRYTDIEFEGSTCSVPILSNIKSVEVGVYAGELCTTVPCLIKCERSILCGNGAEDNTIKIAVDSAREEYRADLENSLETVTGENHDNKTWEELNETVSTLPIISEEQTQALGDLDLIKFYYANLVSDYARIFRFAPKDETGADMDYRLPYIYTPKINWASGVISKNLLEFGVDVSSTDSNTIGNNLGARVFSPLPKLQRLVVTGNKNNQSLQRFMYQNTALRYVKMETPSEEVLRLNPSYYIQAFYQCSSLGTIDCELDFTGQTSTSVMFSDCENLRNLRIKPFTLRCSLDVSACKHFIHPDIRDNSLLSILNAIPNPTTEGENSNITIKYSNYAWVFDTMGDMDFEIPLDFTTVNEVYFNSETGLYSWEKQTETDRLTTLYYAFITDKGVTLAK